MDTFLGIFRDNELRRKLFITLALLVVYRLGSFITLPGVDSGELTRLVDSFSQDSEGMGRVVGMLNMFTGGALANAAVFALGIMPYITASILFQVLSAVYPSLKKMSKEGEAGKRKLNQYTRYATLVLCLFQATMICNALQQPMEGYILVPNPGITHFVIPAVICLTAGTMIVMWLGEMITEFGLGNGISVIIMAGILARLPVGIFGFVDQLQTGDANPAMAFGLLAFFLVMVIAIVYTQFGQRQIPLGQNRRAVAAEGQQQAQGRRYLPLRVNQAGVIPIIFAQSIIMFFPSVLGELLPWRGFQYLSPGEPLYILTYLFLIIFFTFFYTALVFNPQEMAENMKQGGTFIPRFRPGIETEKYLGYILTRITVAGAVILATIAIVPQILSSGFHVDYMLAGIFGGTGLLIVVGVAIDMMQKVEGHLVTTNFEAQMQGPARGRR